MTLTLPFPPSANRYWRHVGNRVVTSREAREYRSAVAGVLLAHRSRSRGLKTLLSARLNVTIVLHPPNRRKFDIDNRVKQTLDALQRAGLYEDDEQIDHLTIARAGIVAGGQAVVCVEPI